MRDYCSDCGSPVYSGVCTNCHEELYIYDTQFEYLPNDLSESFIEKVNDQKKGNRK